MQMFYLDNCCQIGCAIGAETEDITEELQAKSIEVSLVDISKYRIFSDSRKLDVVILCLRRCYYATN